MCNNWNEWARHGISRDACDGGEGLCPLPPPHLGCGTWGALELLTLGFFQLREHTKPFMTRDVS